MANQSLTIKDGNGNLTSLEVGSGSYGLIPYHFVTSSANNPLSVAVSSSVDNPVYLTGTLFVADNYAVDGNLALLTKITASTLEVVEKSAKQSTVTSFKHGTGFDWTVDSGTFVLANEDGNRKGLLISNLSSYNLYVVLGSGSDNGFIIDTTASSPALFSFIIYPSGTYVSEPVIASTFHAGFFVSQSNFMTDNLVMSTKISY